MSGGTFCGGTVFTMTTVSVRRQAILEPPAVKEGVAREAYIYAPCVKSVHSSFCFSWGGAFAPLAPPGYAPASTPFLHWTSHASPIRKSTRSVNRPSADRRATPLHSKKRAVARKVDREKKRTGGSGFGD